MGLVANIKAWLSSGDMKREMKKNRVNSASVSFDAARKIGYLYDATEDRDYEIMKQYLKTIRNQQKEVRALGFVNHKQLPSNKFPQYGLDFFCKKDLNWKGIPSNTIVNNFINEDFDIVVNLNDNNVFSLCYIAAVSKAKFRVGKYNHHQLFVNFYDMMIKTDDENLQTFISETEKYLRKIKIK